jgi:tetratricopeptide (TPR) repeat protein
MATQTVRFPLLVLLPALLAATAPAQADDAGDCRVIGPGQLAACERLIADPAVAGGARVEALLFHAEAIRRTGNREVSLADLRQAEKLAPNDPDVLIHLAKYFYDERNLAESEAYIRRAAEVAPDNPVPQNVWGKIHLLRDDYPAAIARFRAAIARDANHANSHWNLANALYKTGDLDAALAEYRICEALFPRGRQKTNAAMMAAEVSARLASKP